MGLLLNYANGSMTFFDTGLFDNRRHKENIKSYIFEVYSEYPPELHELVDDYSFHSEVMTIEPEIAGKK